jgi:protein-S-isoprenylcysteine O-methyltransferase Ste14
MRGRDRVKLASLETMSENQKAFAGLFLLIAAVMAALFIPAGTIHYWQAWIFLAFFFVPALAITVYLMAKDPKLLARRMRGGPVAEKQPAQRIIMSIVSVGFIALLVVPALDHRLAWSHMPAAISLAGNALMAIGWLATFFVFRENSFSSATIEIADDHKVVSTGPYAWVRHPMYAGAVLMLLGMPVALGSWWGVAVFLVMLPAFAWRMFDEEKFLTENLPGYAEYRQKVRFRLIPGVW